MMRLNRTKLLGYGVFLIWLSFIGLIAIFAGCAAHVPASGTTPAQQGTPIEQALAYNAVLANTNFTVANAVIDAQKQDAISIDAANRVLTAQSLIADGDRQLTSLIQTVALCLKTSTPAQCKTTPGRVQSLVGQIRRSVVALTSGPDLGIKNPNTQVTIIGGVNAIAGTLDSIMAALGAAGVL